MDELINCKRCGGNACYKSEVIENVFSFLCFGCGFSSTTLFKLDSEDYTSVVDSLPELYKDLLFTDEDSQVWLPATINIPDLGIVFLDGSSVEDFYWTAAKARPLFEEEKDRYPEGTATKMDMEKAVKFHKSKFMDALEYIDFYKFISSNE